MIKCYTPCCFEVEPKGWLSKLLLKLGLFGWQAKIWTYDMALSKAPGITYYKHYNSNVLKGDENGK